MEFIVVRIVLHQILLHCPAGGLLCVGIALVDVAVEGGAYRFRLPGVLPQQLGQLATVGGMPGILMTR